MNIPYFMNGTVKQSEHVKLDLAAVKTPTRLKKTMHVTRNGPKIRTLEQMIIDAAYEKGGLLSSTEICLYASISLDQAEQTLEDWAKHNYIQIKIATNGSILYQFPFLKANTEPDAEV